MPTPTFRIGDVEVTEVLESEMTVDMAVAFGSPDGAADFGAEPLAALRAGLPGELFDDTGDPRLIFRSHLLRTPGGVILLDTGWGNDKQRLLDPYAHLLRTDYLDRLAAAGVRPEDVDHVFCTHLHQDHVGWNTRLVDGAWTPTFPNATYLFVRSEYEHWAATTATGEGYGHDSFADSVRPVVDAGLSRLVEPGEAIVDGVRVEPLVGHTPGHCGLHVSSVGEEAVFSGDLFHVAYQLTRPDWHIVVEHDAAIGEATRRRFCREYADRDVRIVPAHFNAPAGVYLIGSGDTYVVRLAETR